ncbi:MAG: DUF1178 family protein [Deltaproteobacteria bacterium]|jgi:hypothetical protein|nr:DUF1178 family protein [Deltaproteobacteria bacterium]
MVIFDLICLKGHHFEGWFADLADLEGQQISGQLSCPVCGDENISRLPSTFGLVRRRSEQTQPQTHPQNQAQAEVQDTHGMTLKAFKELVAMSDRLEKDFVDVGTDFTAEALKMHYGVTPVRNIRGQSTADEEQILKNEGIEFFKLPMLNRKNTAS